MRSQSRGLACIGMVEGIVPPAPLDPALENELKTGGSLRARQFLTGCAALIDSNELYDLVQNVETHRCKDS